MKKKLFIFVVALLTGLSSLQSQTEKVLKFHDFTIYDSNWKEVLSNTSDVTITITINADNREYVIVEKYFDVLNTFKDIYNIKSEWKEVTMNEKQYNRASLYILGKGYSTIWYNEKKVIIKTHHDEYAVYY